METYNYDESSAAADASTASGGVPAAPGFGPLGPVTPTVPDPSMDNSPAAPGFGPLGPVTPTVPGNGNNSPAAPGFGPVGPVTPTVPSGGNNSCTSCGTVVWPGNTTGILWTWGTLAPFFSTSSEVAHVRFYNAASIQEPLDIYLNGRLVVSNLDYMNYTRYLHIIPGVYRLSVYRRTNPGTAIVDTNVRFRSGTSYTMTILGTVGDFSVQMMTS